MDFYYIFIIFLLASQIFGSTKMSELEAVGDRENSGERS